MSSHVSNEPDLNNPETFQTPVIKRLLMSLFYIYIDVCFPVTILVELWYMWCKMMAGVE